MISIDFWWLCGVAVGKELVRMAPDRKSLGPKKRTKLRPKRVELSTDCQQKVRGEFCWNLTQVHPSFKVMIVTPCTNTLTIFL